MDEINYPEYLDKLPPNHNPVIGFSRDDTLANVADVLAVLEHLFVFPDGEQHADFSKEETTGMACILSCLMQALRFEINHRRKAVRDLSENHREAM